MVTEVRCVKMRRSCKFISPLHVQETQGTMLASDFDGEKKSASYATRNASNKLTEEFWKLINQKCKENDKEFIERLVKTKQMTLEDTDKDGRTLLHIAAETSSQIVQFCINSGCDIDAQNTKGETALDRAQVKGQYHIEQLLLFSKMNLSLGNEIKNTAEAIQRQDGINHNISTQLALIGAQSQELFDRTLMELMINMIQKRLSFSDNLLIYCWDIASRSPQGALSSPLWQAISSTCRDIIKGGSQTEWYWFKQCLMTSTIWYRKCPTDDATDSTGTYLYYQLLTLVDAEAKNQLDALEEDLNVLANKSKDQNEWNELVKWNYGTTHSEQLRQDTIPNGITNAYPYSQLAACSDDTFNSPRFHDYNQYLSQLVLLAHMVDDEFHKSVQNIVCDVRDCAYMRGPVKLKERATAKSEIDYRNQAFPTSACVIDFNRCALVFHGISSLLQALDLFATKVKQHESGNIIDIVRCKNGFIQFVQQPAYADIKLNVVIKGEQHAIIGEIQFLLKTMKSFKDKAHNLYAVQRKEEGMTHSVSKILPLVLDQDKQLAIAGTTGNIKLLCQLMVFYNKSSVDLMKPDGSSGRNVLYRVCRNGQTKALLFFKSILLRKDFIRHVLADCFIDSCCIETAIWFSRTEIIKHLFELEEIMTKYKKDPFMFRLLLHLFVGNERKDFMDFVISLLGITKEKLVHMMTYRFPSNLVKPHPKAHPYDRYAIATAILALEGTFQTFKRCISVIGEQAFINNVVFHVDGWNLNPMECALKHDKPKVIEYILSLEEVKGKYMSDEGELLFRLMYCLFGYGKPQTIDYVLSELEISSDKIKTLMKYKYPVLDRKYGADAEEYHLLTIIGNVVCKNTLDAFEKLVKIMGDTMMCEAVFSKDEYNKNAMQYAVENNKLEMVKYMLRKQEIKSKISNDENELYPIILQLNEDYNSNEETLGTYVMSELKVSQSMLSKLQQKSNQEEVDISAILKMINVDNK
eukprot:6952_1